MASDAGLTLVATGRLFIEQDLDVMALAAAGRSQPRSQLTNGRIVSRSPVLSSRQCWGCHRRHGC